MKLASEDPHEDPCLLDCTPPLKEVFCKIEPCCNNFGFINGNPLYIEPQSHIWSVNKEADHLALM
jgi:hypothetical protein